MCKSWGKKGNPAEPQKGDLGAFVAQEEYIAGREILVGVFGTPDAIGDRPTSLLDILTV